MTGDTKRNEDRDLSTALILEEGNFVSSYNSPTEHFTILEHRNPPINVFEQLKICQLTGFKVL